MRRSLILLVVFSLFLVSCSSQVDIHDLNSDELKFITANPYNLEQVREISKFRSCAGHDYSGLNVHGEMEDDRSMKHYFTPIEEIRNSEYVMEVFAPVDGKIVSNVKESNPRGKKVKIEVEGFESWEVVLFHIDLDEDLRVGSFVQAGQLVGYGDLVDGGNIDIALREDKGLRKSHASFFSYASDEVLEEYAVFNLTIDDFSFSKEERDLLACDFGVSRNDDDWVLLRPEGLEGEEEVVIGLDHSPENHGGEFVGEN